MKESLLGTSEESFLTDINEDIYVDIVISVSKAWNHSSHHVIIKETRWGKAKYSPQPFLKGPPTFYSVNITG